MPESNVIFEEQNPPCIASHVADSQIHTHAASHPQLLPPMLVSIVHHPRLAD